MTGGRYGRNLSDPMDLAETLRRLEERVRVLETARRSTMLTIGDGGQVVLDGARLILSTSADPEQPGTKGRIILDAVSVGSDQGYELVVEHAVGLNNAADRAVLRVRTVDGSIQDIPIGATFEVRDKLGNLLISNSTGDVAGFGEPKLVYNFHSLSNLISTTSDTASTIAQFTWYAYHPYLRVEIYVQNDASTSSIVTVERSDGTEVAEITYAGSVEGYFQIDIDRTDVSGGGNGLSHPMVVKHRRSSGAGTCRTMVTDVVGLDLS